MIIFNMVVRYALSSFAARILHYTLYILYIKNFSYFLYSKYLTFFAVKWLLKKVLGEIYMVLKNIKDLHKVLKRSKKLMKHSCKQSETVKDINTQHWSTPRGTFEQERINALERIASRFKIKRSTPYSVSYFKKLNRRSKNRIGSELSMNGMWMG